jgi:hypothetical protein
MRLALYWRARSLHFIIFSLSCQPSFTRYYTWTVREALRVGISFPSVLKQEPEQEPQDQQRTGIDRLTMTATEQGTIVASTITLGKATYFVRDRVEVLYIQFLLPEIG